MVVVVVHLPCHTPGDILQVHHSAYWLQEPRVQFGGLYLSLLEKEINTMDKKGCTIHNSCSLVISRL